MNVSYPTGTTVATQALVGGSIGTVATDALLLRAPGAIPKDDLFFWTRRWQEGEAESAAARAQGDVREFDSGGDVVRWLLSDDE
jgi:hypothetical protein